MRHSNRNRSKSKACTAHMVKGLAYEKRKQTNCCVWISCKWRIKAHSKYLWHDIKIVRFFFLFYDSRILILIHSIRKKNSLYFCWISLSIGARAKIPSECQQSFHATEKRNRKSEIVFLKRLLQWKKSHRMKLSVRLPCTGPQLVSPWKYENNVFPFEICVCFISFVRFCCSSNLLFTSREQSHWIYSRRQCTQC